MKKETNNSAQVGRLKFISHDRNIWNETPEEDWNNWMWQQSKRVKTIQACEKVINLSEGEVRAFKESSDKFNVGITPYYASLMDKDDPNCPI
ncbi:lysine 2,3-aminomutase, partial [bacterium]|nr:lysine 2,3-aminomutase [bacterium]